MGPGGGDDDQVCAGRLARANPGLGVFEHQAVGDVEAQSLGCQTIAGRVGLALFHPFGRDHQFRRRHPGRRQPGAGEGHGC
ncbi:MAG: hypothetical protein A2352_13925 [Caulobacterales bacterium RIFOXYB1_FULL_67_16]|nr:MAG: hypothetical protein A2352_13925 [Caulobacterales bacterium RIFOXYB1_FULL_67_16]